MAEKRVASRSPLLPVGIVMVLMSFGFTFGPNGIRWMWQFEPTVAVVLAVAGAVFIGVYIAQRTRGHTR